MGGEAIRLKRARAGCARLRAPPRGGVKSQLIPRFEIGVPGRFWLPFPSGPSAKLCCYPLGHPGAGRSQRKERKTRGAVRMENPTQTHSGPEVEAGKGLSIGRYFTTPGQHPFDTVEWELREARIGHGDKV